MTYDAKEDGEYSGHPVELLTFTRGTSLWRYTDADEDKVVGAFTYFATPFKRGEIEQTQDSYRTNLTFTIDRSAAVLEQYIRTPPTDVVSVVLQRYHEDDGELTTPWMGRIVNVKFYENEAEMICEPIYTSMKRSLLRRRYQRLCPYVLYSVQCGVNRGLHAVDATLLTVSSNIITASQFGLKADGYYAGGWVEWNSDGVIDKRFILSHTGTTIELNLPFHGMPSGVLVRAYPGCDHTINTCDSKFNNHENYGGQPYYPEMNPFTKQIF